MTFSIGHVQGGTNAGRRVVKTWLAEPWECECVLGRECRTSRCDGLLVNGMCPFGYGVTCDIQPKRQPAYLVRCPDCGTRRP